MGWLTRHRLPRTSFRSPADPTPATRRSEMNTRVVRQDTGYTFLPTAAINDRNLTYAARGVLMFLLALDSGERMGTEDLIAASPGGAREVADALILLRRCGYLTDSP